MNGNREEAGYTKKKENVSHCGGYSTYLSVFMTGCEEGKEANEWKEC